MLALDRMFTKGNKLPGRMMMKALVDIKVNNGQGYDYDGDDVEG